MRISLFLLSVIALISGPIMAQQNIQVSAEEITTFNPLYRLHAAISPDGRGIVLLVQTFSDTSGIELEDKLYAVKIIQRPDRLVPFKPILLTEFGDREAAPSIANDPRTGGFVAVWVQRDENFVVDSLRSQFFNKRGTRVGKPNTFKRAEDLVERNPRITAVNEPVGTRTFALVYIARNLFGNEFIKLRELDARGRSKTGDRTIFDMSGPEFDSIITVPIGVFEQTNGDYIIPVYENIFLDAGKKGRHVHAYWHKTSKGISKQSKPIVEFSGSDSFQYYISVGRTSPGMFAVGYGKYDGADGVPAEEFKLSRFRANANKAPGTSEISDTVTSEVSAIVNDEKGRAYLVVHNGGDISIVPLKLNGKPNIANHLDVDIIGPFGDGRAFDAVYDTANNQIIVFYTSTETVNGEETETVYAVRIPMS